MGLKLKNELQAKSPKSATKCFQPLHNDLRLGEIKYHHYLPFIILIDKLTAPLRPREKI